MKVLVRNRQQTLKISSAAVSAIASHVIFLERQNYQEVAIHLVGPKAICKLHQDHFQDASITDCISFPVENSENMPYRMLGDVFVCPQVAVDYANRHHTDPFQETTLYIVHGLLHLLGYDDIDPKDRQRMRRAERRHMKALLTQGLCLTQRK